MDLEDTKPTIKGEIFHLPGWYWYLKDEKDFRELPNAENVLEVCLRVMTDKF